MDERFEDPSDGVEEEDAVTDDETTETSVESEGQGRETAATEDRSDQVRTAATTDTDSSTSETGETDEPLNIREDWDSATIYVEPDQSEDIEITFTRLKKQLKRENITLEKNKHFYRGIFEVAFGEHREETKEKIRELAKQDVGQ
jgi:hypothetical protein